MKKKMFLLVFVFGLLKSFAQANLDSIQKYEKGYNIGFKIGENLPVIIILTIFILIIYKSYRNSSDDHKKTDFLDDGTIKK